MSILFIIQCLLLGGWQYHWLGPQLPVISPSETSHTCMSCWGWGDGLDAFLPLQVGRALRSLVFMTACNCAATLFKHPRGNFHSRNGCLEHGLNRNANACIQSLKLGSGQVFYCHGIGLCILLPSEILMKLNMQKIHFHFSAKQCLILTFYWGMEPVLFHNHWACQFRSMLLGMLFLSF